MTLDVNRERLDLFLSPIDAGQTKSFLVVVISLFLMEWILFIREVRMQAHCTINLRFFTIVPVVRPFCEFGSLIDLLPTHTPPRGASPLLCAATVVQLVPTSLSRACLVRPWRGLPLGAGLLPRHVCSCRADCSSSLSSVFEPAWQVLETRCCWKLAT